MKSIAIGIMPQEQIRRRMLAIASGKYQPKRGEPKVWLTSMMSLAESSLKLSPNRFRRWQESSGANLAIFPEH